MASARTSLRNGQAKVRHPLYTRSQASSGTPSRRPTWTGEGQRVRQIQNAPAMPAGWTSGFPEQQLRVQAGETTCLGCERRVIRLCGEFAVGARRVAFVRVCSCIFSVLRHPAFFIRPSQKILAITGVATYSGTHRRGGRVVEGAPLLREYTSKAYRGFESLPLRHFPLHASPDGPISTCKDSILLCLAVPAVRAHSIGKRICERVSQRERAGISERCANSGRYPSPESHGAGDGLQARGLGWIAQFYQPIRRKADCRMTAPTSSRGRSVNGL